MMKNNLTLLVIIMFFNLLLNRITIASDCSDMNNQEIIRLDTEGGPLYQSPVQDQDGIGTCYANATSIALKTALPGQPDLSYLQLAINYAQKNETPKNKLNGVDSAFKSDSGPGEVLINGGYVCDTIKATQENQNGVCKRNDVALENLLFNSSASSFHDSAMLQNKIIQATSEYYDSVKNNLVPGAAVEDISHRINRMTKQQQKFKKAIEQRQKEYTKEFCSKPDISIAESVTKNIIAKIYLHLKNKGISASNLSRVKNPLDKKLFFFTLSSGNPLSSDGPDSEVIISLPKDTKDFLLKNYMKQMLASPPPISAQAVYKNIIKDMTPKLDPEIYKAFFEKISPSDVSILEKDFSRYVKRDIDECAEKNKLAYYNNLDGLVKDFSGMGCEAYKKQSISLNKLSVLLSDNNLSSLEQLNNYITNIPHLSYEEALRAITAPNCNNSNKIHIPSALTCVNNSKSYTQVLEQYVYDHHLKTQVEVNVLVKNAEAAERTRVSAAFDAEIVAINVNPLYLNKIDKESIEKKNSAIKTAEDKKKNQLKEVTATIRNVIMKSLVGAETETALWNNYKESNKNKFRSDTLTRLKNSKQAITLSICTRVFDDQNATALRDGSCQKDSSLNNKYASVGGYHAVTVTGAKCLNGKISYLVQNSWGDWNQIKETKNADQTQHYETEFGKAWFSEDELINNTFNYQNIDFKK